VEALLAQGAKVNARDRNGSTSLMLASKAGHREVVEVLLVLGAKVNAKDWLGRTALMVAARQVRELLIQKGAK
jgi:ankyrin repeat protein